MVRRGDSLRAIASKYEVPLQKLAEENKLGPKSRLERGRTLVIPDPEDEAPPVFKPKKIDTLTKTGRVVPGGVQHTVQRGQSLWIIARAYNTSGERIAASNGFAPTESLQAGREIPHPGCQRSGSHAN